MKLNYNKWIVYFLFFCVCIWYKSFWTEEVELQTSPQALEKNQ